RRRDRVTPRPLRCPVGQTHAGPRGTPPPPVDARSRGRYPPHTPAADFKGSPHAPLVPCRLLGLHATAAVLPLPRPGPRAEATPRPQGPGGRVPQPPRLHRPGPGPLPAVADAAPQARPVRGAVHAAGLLPHAPGLPAH